LGDRYVETWMTQDQDHYVVGVLDLEDAEKAAIEEALGPGGMVEAVRREVSRSELNLVADSIWSMLRPHGTEQWSSFDANYERGTVMIMVPSAEVVESLATRIREELGIEAATGDAARRLETLFDFTIAGPEPQVGITVGVVSTAVGEAVIGISENPPEEEDLSTRQADGGGDSLGQVVGVPGIGGDPGGPTVVDVPKNPSKAVASKVRISTKVSVKASNRAKVRVTVKAKGIAKPVGKVTVSWAKGSKTVKVAKADKGTVTLKLPRLAHGKYRLTAKFTPSDTRTLPSKSTKTVLKVI
jgi:hypothetical protein